MPLANFALSQRSELANYLHEDEDDDNDGDNDELYLLHDIT